MLRDTAAQDRPIERPSLWRRHGKLAAAALVAVVGLCVLVGVWLRYSGAGASVDRSRLTIATVERGSFVRDIVADGQVVAAVSPTLYANALGTVSLKVHAGDSGLQGAGARRRRQPRLDGQTVAGRSHRRQPAHRLASARLSRPSASSRSSRTPSSKRRSTRRPRSASSIAARKAYELGSYTELQALKAQDALGKGAVRATHKPS